MNQELFSYIAASPTAFQAVAHTALLLEQAGYRPLRESEEWSIEPDATARRWWRFVCRRKGHAAL